MIKPSRLASRNGLSLSLAGLSRKDLALLEAAARKSNMTLPAFVLKRIERYARFLASREVLRQRAVAQNDPVFASAYTTLLKNGERPTAHRLAQMTDKQYRAAQGWLQLRHPQTVRKRGKGPRG